jgi:pimeloyl-ACP methyl ester carboxylesterase
MKADDERMAFIPVLAESLESGKGIGPLIEQLAPADRPKPTAEQIAAINQMLMLTNDAKALAACIRGIHGLAVTEDSLRANQVPTLCIIGEKDPLKAGVDELAGCMSNVKVVVVPGADHMTCFTQPKFVNELKAFLEAQSPMPATAGAGGK